MRHWLAAIGAICALLEIAPAQQPGGGPIGGGQIVSTGVNLNQAGTRIPAAAPQAGNNIGSPLMKPYDPSRPTNGLKDAAAMSGVKFDPSTIAAPVTGLPGTQQPDLLDRVYAKLGSVTNFFRPTAPTPQVKTVTPGIFRRNRERAQQTMAFRRD